MDENSTSAQSADSQQSDNQQSVYEELQDDGQWLVAIRYDGNGTIEGYTAIPHTEGEGLVVSALETYHQNEVDALESVPSDNQDNQDAYAPETVIMHCCIILVFAVLAVVGAVACQTLMRAMERK